MDAAEDEHLLDLAVAQALERVGQQGDAAEWEEYAGLVEAEHLEATIVRVGQDHSLEDGLVAILAALGLELRDGAHQVDKTHLGLRLGCLLFWWHDGECSRRLMVLSSTMQAWF